VNQVKGQWVVNNKIISR